MSLVSLILEIETRFCIKIPPDIQTIFYAYDTITKLNKLINELISFDQKKKPIEYQVNLNDRIVHSEIFLSSELNYNALILGSSRSMAMKASLFNECHLSGFNMCYSNGRLLDNLYSIKFFLEHNKSRLRVVIIGIDLENFDDQYLIDPRTLDCSFLKKYDKKRNINDQQQNISLRFNNILSNIRQKEYSQSTLARKISLDPKTCDVIDTNGNPLNEVHLIQHPDSRQNVMFMQLKDLHQLGK